MNEPGVKKESFDNGSAAMKMSLINFNQKGMCKRIDNLEVSIETLKKEVLNLIGTVDQLERDFKNVDGKDIHEPSKNHSS